MGWAICGLAAGATGVDELDGPTDGMAPELPTDGEDELDAAVASLAAPLFAPLTIWRVT
jgi:hypothetical protein